MKTSLLKDNFSMFWNFTKSKVILRKKDVGKIYLNIDDPIEKAKIANLKNGGEYTFNLTNR